MVEQLEARRLLAAAELFTTLPDNIDSVNVLFDEAAAVGNDAKLILVGHQGTQAESLYAADATGAPAIKLLTAAPSFAERLGITALTPFNGKVYFLANTSVSGERRNSLFSTDGTADGTQEVKLLHSGSTSALPPQTYLLDGRFYFTLQHNSGGRGRLGE